MATFALLALAGVLLALVIMKPWEVDFATYTNDHDSDWSLGDWFGGDGDGGWND